MRWVLMTLPFWLKKQCSASFFTFMAALQSAMCFAKFEFILIVLLLPVFFSVRVNVSPLSRKAILKKVDGTDFSPLGDTNTNTAAPTAKQARFTVYYADRQTVVRVRTSGKDTYETLENLLSGVSGAFWIGKLPYGTYYLCETTIPSGYQHTTTGDTYNWFILTVNENGVGYLQAGDQANTDKILNMLKPETTKP